MSQSPEKTGVETPAIESLLFATPEGNLMTEDPRQTKLDLKPIAVEAKELKQINAA